MISTHFCEHGAEAHSIAEIKYRDKLVGTANLTHLDLDNVKYTIAFNKDKSRAWHFFNSKDIFFKWEAEHKTPENIHIFIKEPGDKLKGVKAYIAQEVNETK